MPNPYRLIEKIDIPEDTPDLGDFIVELVKRGEEKGEVMNALIRIYGRQKIRELYLRKKKEVKG